jgi:predicted RNase H-like HicB family nuclease
MSNSRSYPVEVFWSDEDGGFLAIAYDLPGCSAFGRSESEAVIALRDAIEAWIEAATVAGNPIPVPSRPADPEQFSGKFVVRVPRQLHADLTRSARAEGISLNQFVLYVLTKGVEARSYELTSPFWMDAARLVATAPVAVAGAEPARAGIIMPADLAGSVDVAWSTKIYLLQKFKPGQTFADVTPPAKSATLKMTFFDNYSAFTGATTTRALKAN